MRARDLMTDPNSTSPLCKSSVPRAKVQCDDAMRSMIGGENLLLGSANLTVLIVWLIRAVLFVKECVNTSNNAKQLKRDSKLKKLPPK